MIRNRSATKTLRHKEEILIKTFIKKLTIKRFGFLINFDDLVISRIYQVFGV